MYLAWCLPVLSIVQASLLRGVVKLVLYHLSLTVGEASLDHHRGGGRCAGSGGQAAELSPHPLRGPGCSSHPLVVVAVVRLSSNLQKSYCQGKSLEDSPINWTCSQ